MVQARRGEGGVVPRQGRGGQVPEPEPGRPDYIIDEKEVTVSAPWQRLVIITRTARPWLCSSHNGHPQPLWVSSECASDTR